MLLCGTNHIPKGRSIRSEDLVFQSRGFGGQPHIENLSVARPRAGCESTCSQPAHCSLPPRLPRAETDRVRLPFRLRAPVPPLRLSHHRPHRRRSIPPTGPSEQAMQRQTVPPASRSLTSAPACKYPLPCASGPPRWRDTGRCRHRTRPSRAMPWPTDPSPEGRQTVW